VSLDRKRNNKGRMFQAPIWRAIVEPNGAPIMDNYWYLWPARGLRDDVMLGSFNGLPFY
jgi:hypothetical protein